MSGADFVALLPLVALAAGGTAVMLAGAFGASARWLHGMTVSSFGVALASIGYTRTLVPRDVTPLLRVDAFALLFWTLLFAATGLLAIIAQPYLRARGRDGEAFHALLLFAATGMGVLACSSHFAAVFLGLETLTIALYGLLGYLREDHRSLEAAAKYLILAALASGLLLFGIALLYAATGTLDIGLTGDGVRRLVAAEQAPEAAWAVSGVVLLLVGFAFKLALVPFHMWSPDVYQGAPAPVTALIATGSKGAVIAVVIRLLVPEAGSAMLAPMLGALAVATMIVGNLLALLQDDLKRLLAYSSVAHLGYAFVALSAGGRIGGEAVVLYVVTYVATTLGAFAVVTILSSTARGEVDRLTSYRGLGRRRPALAAALGVMLLSLAGIPPSGGFLAKFAVLRAAVGAEHSALAVVMVAASGIGVYYYLRVLVVMYMQSSEAPADGATRARAAGSPVSATLPAEPIPAGAAMALGTLVLVVLAIGLHPSPWLRAVGAAIAAIWSV